ncbi:MAG: prolipoprotein diacylglyceryl transferase [Bacilli bacterium]|nr:prolipoprotein diacylglyceryl transferase [Bacilli bacterium]
MNPVMLTLFGIEIRWYSFLILIGIIIGVILIEKEAKKFNISRDEIFDMCFYAIVFGILGARLYYVLFNVSYYKYNLLEIFAIWQGGLAIHGGLIVGVLVIYLYAKKKHFNFLRLLDMAAPSVILAQGIGRWGNFFNSEAHGFATTYNALKNLHVPEFIINGMKIGGTYYLPTFYFEFLWCILGLIVLLIIRRLKYTKIGETSCIYLMWYSFGRFFIEGWRTDSLMLGGCKGAQIISIILFVGSLIYLIYLHNKGKYADLYNDINKGRIN